MYVPASIHLLRVTLCCLPAAALYINRIQFPLVALVLFKFTSKMHIYWRFHIKSKTHHAFLFISLTSTARIRRETSQFAVLWRTWTYDDEFSFLFLNLNKILKLQLQEKSPAFDILSGSKHTWSSLKECKFIFLPTFSLTSSSSLLKVPINYAVNVFGKKFSRLNPWTETKSFKQNLHVFRFSLPSLNAWRVGPTLQVSSFCDRETVELIYSMHCNIRTILYIAERLVRLKCWFLIYDYLPCRYPLPYVRLLS